MNARSAGSTTRRRRLDALAQEMPNARVRSVLAIQVAYLARDLATLIAVSVKICNHCVDQDSELYTSRAWLGPWGVYFS